MNKPTVLVTIIIVFLAIAIFATYDFGTTRTASNSNSTALIQCSGCQFKVSGAWNYTIMLNSTTVARGETIQLSANLSNVSNENQVVTIGRPTILVSVNRLNGGTIWAYQPLQSTWPNVTVTSGQSLFRAVQWEFIHNLC